MVHIFSVITQWVNSPWKFSNVFIVQFEQVFSHKEHITVNPPIIANFHTRGTYRTPFNTHSQISENFTRVKTRKVSQGESVTS